MSWKDRAEAYKEIGSIAGRRDDDFCARKILRGLGWTERGLPLLCMRTGVRYDGAEPLINLARKILDAVSLGEFDTGSSSCKFVMDVRPMEKGGVFWANDDEFRELSDIANTAGIGLLMFGRKPARGASDECVACLMMRDCMDVPPWLLQPVSVLKERKFGTMAWMRRADEMVASMAEFRNWDVPKPED